MIITEIFYNLIHMNKQIEKKEGVTYVLQILRKKIRGRRFIL